MMAVSNLRDRKWLVGVVGVFTLAVLAVVSMVSRSDATDGAPLSGTFSVLESDSVSTAALSEGAREWLGDLASFGGAAVAPSEIGVASTSTGDQVVVAASGNSLCFHSMNAGLSNCADASLSAAGQVFTASPDFSASPNGCAGWNVLGVMPDGVKSLSVDAPGGKGPATIAVESNVYMATLAPVRTTLSSGSISVEIPLDEYAAGSSGC